MADVSISAVVMTLNEERNIEFCLRSVRPWCDEIVVADNYSDDRTPEIAKRFADKFLSNERFEGFDAGREKAFEAATGAWILSIDADEVVTPQLAAWIREFIDSDPPYDVVLVPRANVSWAAGSRAHLGGRASRACSGVARSRSPPSCTVAWYRCPGRVSAAFRVTRTCRCGTSR